MNVAQNLDGLGQPAELAERAGEAIGGRCIDELPHDDMGRRQPVLQRCGQANELIPLLNYEIEVDGVAEQRLLLAVVATRSTRLSTRLGRFFRRGMRGDAVGFGGVLADRQYGVIVEKAAGHKARNALGLRRPLQRRAGLPGVAPSARKTTAPSVRGDAPTPARGMTP